MVLINPCLARSVIRVGKKQQAAVRGVEWESPSWFVDTHDSLDAPVDRGQDLQLGQEGGDVVVHLCGIRTRVETLRQGDWVSQHPTTMFALFDQTKPPIHPERATVRRQEERKRKSCEVR